MQHAIEENGVNSKWPPMHLLSWFVISSTRRDSEPKTVILLSEVTKDVKLRSHIEDGDISKTSVPWFGRHYQNDWLKITNSAGVDPIRRVGKCFHTTKYQSIAASKTYAGGSPIHESPYPVLTETGPFSSFPVLSRTPKG